MFFFARVIIDGTVTVRYHTCRCWYEVSRYRSSLSAPFKNVDLILGSKKSLVRLLRYTQEQHIFLVDEQVGRVSDPDPDWIRIQSGQWIRIRIRNPVPDPGWPLL